MLVLMGRNPHGNINYGTLLTVHPTWATFQWAGLKGHFLLTYDLIKCSIAFLISSPFKTYFSWLLQYRGLWLNFPNKFKSHERHQMDLTFLTWYALSCFLKLLLEAADPGLGKTWPGCEYPSKNFCPSNDVFYSIKSCFRVLVLLVSAWVGGGWGCQYRFLPNSAICGNAVYV